MLAFVSAVWTENITQHLQAKRQTLKLISAFDHIDQRRDPEVLKRDSTLKNIRGQMVQKGQNNVRNYKFSAKYFYQHFQIFSIFIYNESLQMISSQFFKIFKRFDKEREKTLMQQSLRKEKLGKVGLCFITGCFIKSFFSIRVFFHKHWRFTGQQEKGVDHLLFHSSTSTNSRTLRHLFPTLHMRWL